MKEVNCKHCGRYLFMQAGTVVIEKMICPNSDCKATLNIKIITADPFADVKHKFVNPERAPRKKEVEVS